MDDSFNIPCGQEIRSSPSNRDQSSDSLDLFPNLSPKSVSSNSSPDSDLNINQDSDLIVCGQDVHKSGPSESDSDSDYLYPYELSPESQLEAALSKGQISKRITRSATKRKADSFQNININLIEPSTSAAADTPAETIPVQASRAKRTKTGKAKKINLFHLSKQLESWELILEFCFQNKLLPQTRNCPNCKEVLTKITTVKRTARRRPEYRYQCNKSKCKKSNKNQVPLRHKTWFANAHITLRKSLILTYCFVYNLDYKQAIHETSISEADTSDDDNDNILSTSSTTIADYYSYCREVCVSVCEKLATNKKIGGPGLTVEIDESKFGKRKFQKGRLIEGQWVFGGICRETKEIFLVPCPDNKRDKATLIPLITNHIADGSTVISDCWKAYDR
jgi:hypothetical protein